MPSKIQDACSVLVWIGSDCKSRLGTQLKLVAGYHAFELQKGAELEKAMLNFTAAVMRTMLRLSAV